MNKHEDTIECASHFCNTLSTLSEKENESSETFGSIMARQALLNLEEHSFSVKPICRENQAKQIENFILSGIKMKGLSETLYVAGMPGVGKTLTVTSVIDSLRSNPAYRKKFKSYYLNAMSFKHPSKIYKSLLYKIFKIKNVSRSKQVIRLDYLFTTSTDSKVKVIVIDQLDFLLTEDESVLYNLFEWTQNPNSKLILIAIANTLNLPELLKQKTYSRMGSSKIAFRSYDKQQIHRIVVERLKNIQIFEPDSLMYACTKICSFSCDIRRVLFILRTALSIFIQKSNTQLVQIQHIQQAFNQIVRNKPECAFIHSMPKTNQLILAYLVLDSQSPPKIGECTLSSVALRIRTFHPQISYDAVHRITIDFQQSGILDLKQIVVNHTIDTQIKLNIPYQEIRASLENQEASKLLQILLG